MKTPAKILTLLAVAAAVAAAVVLKQSKSPVAGNAPGQVIVAAASQDSTASSVAAKLPRLVDLGADKCIPCKMMAPILEEMKTNYVGKLEVEFIDVWKNPDAGKKYDVTLIPTQIFYDASGRELFRHIGFYSKDDLLAKWKELGVDLKK